jgi:hypothetical protein
MHKELGDFIVMTVLCNCSEQYGARRENEKNNITKKYIEGNKFNLNVFGKRQVTFLVETVVSVLPNHFNLPLCVCT